MSLAQFVQIIDNSRALLNQAAEISLGKNPCEFFVSGLTHQSPATIEISTRSLHQRAGECVVNELIKQVHAFEKCDSDGLSDESLKMWEKYLKPYENKKIKSSKILFINSTSDKLQEQPKVIMESSHEIVNAIKKAREKETVCKTTVTGRVELLNLHNHDKLKLKVYPRVKEWNPVDVYFSESFKERVIKTMDKVVEISGIGHYRPHEFRPYKMKMDDIEQFPDEKDMPKFSEMRGKFPDITGGKTVDEYIKDLRSEWDR